MTGDRAKAVGVRRSNPIARVALVMASCAATVLVALGMVVTTPGIALAGGTGSNGVGSVGSGQALQISSVDTAHYPRVAFDVTLPPAFGGAPVAPGSFTVSEAGSTRTARETLVSDTQLEVAILVDTSANMGGAPLAAAKRTATGLVAGLPSGAKVAVIGVGSTPDEVFPFSSNTVDAISAIKSLTARGKSALYDSVGMALDQLPPRPDASGSIVVLGDGSDSASHTSLATIEAEVAASGVRLDAISLQTAAANPATLAQLARAGGGQSFPITDPAAIQGIFSTIESSLGAHYRVSFVAQGHGLTPFTVNLNARGVSAIGISSLALPPPPPPPLPFMRGLWALVVGAVAIFFALLLIAFALVPSKEPRTSLSLLGVQGSSGRRGGGTVGPAQLTHVTEQATALAGRLLARSRWRPGLNAALENAGLSLRPEEAVVIGTTSAVVALVVGVLLGGLFVGILLVIITLFGSRFWLRHLGRRRRAQFADQLGDTVLLVASTLRAGYGLLQAVDTVAREAESPTAEEFRRLTIETRLGQDFSVSLRGMADRVGGEDFRWVGQAIEIHREVGGDLAEVLDNVATTIRARNHLHRRIRALSSQGRLSGMILFAMPFVLAGLLSVIHPGYLSPLLHGVGIFLIVGALVLMAFGGLWMRRILRPVF